MARFHEAWLEHQRERWMRHDAHRYWRPDAERWVKPETLRLLGRPAPESFQSAKHAKPNHASLTCRVSGLVRIHSPANPSRREDQSESSRELNAMN
jgi:hypothetical protein